MEDKELNERLKYILGNNAFNNADMQVSKDISSLVKAVHYLATQLQITGKLTNMEDAGDVNNHVRLVIEKTKQIIS